MPAVVQYRPLPAVGDLVWCRFPLMEALGNPGPKPRPALIIAVAPLEHAVQLIYGTTQRTTTLYPSEFVMDPADAGFSTSGLSFRTKFDFNKRVTLKFDSDWFAPAPGLPKNIPLPKLGAMHSCYYGSAKKAFENSRKG